MHTLFNFSADPYDQVRFANQEDFRTYVASFPEITGIELLTLGEQPTIGHSNQADREAYWPIPGDLVFGVHARSIPHWLDFWFGNVAALRKTYPTQEFQDEHYGCQDPAILVKMLQEDADYARALGAHYLVWHIADSAPCEALTHSFSHNSAEVIDASLEILNQVDFSGLTLLLENLWYPGLTLAEPEMTARLLNGVRHSDTGIMLDTGHLAHTNTALRTPEDALHYITQILANDSILTNAIQGIHLNLSLSGAYIEQTRDNPPPAAINHQELMDQLFSYIFAVDRHEPFIAPGLRQLISQIAPKWLTLEFITPNRATHERWLREQLAALQ